MVVGCSKIMITKQNSVKKIALLMLLSVVFTAGCAVRFVYNQLDWAVPWYLRDYISLTGDQKNDFQENLDDYLYWHRVEQLPLYAKFLRRVADQAEDGLNHAELEAVQTESEQLANVLVAAMSPHVVDLFADASDAQLKQLFEKFEQDNAAFRRDSVDISESIQRERWVKEARKYVERWTGKLNDRQKALIAHWGERYKPMGQELMDARLAWQKAFREILAQRKEQRPLYEQQLTALLQNSQFGRSPQFNEKFTCNRDALVALYQSLDASLTSAQRQRFLKTLRSYAEDFEALSKDIKKEEQHA